MTFSVPSKPSGQTCSQAASAKALKWSNMWCAFRVSKHHVAIESNWHSNRSQWAEKEFYCQSSPWGVTGILQESSYSWSLITAKLPICKIRLHLNTTFKSETWTRRLWAPRDTPAVCAEKPKWTGIRGRKWDKRRQIKRHSVYPGKWQCQPQKGSYYAFAIIHNIQIGE